MKNTFLKQYLNFIYTFRYIISVAIPSIILIFSLNLQYFKLDGSYKVWFKKEADILKTYENFTHTFGNDNYIYIVFKDENGIFNKKALKSINRLTKKLLTSMYVEEVKTLLNYRYIHQSKNNPDEIITNNFIKKLDLCDANYFLERKILAIDNKDLINHFISSDTTTTMLIVNLDLTMESKENEILDFIRTILKNESTITNYKYWLNGSFIMKHAFTEVSQQDLRKSIPLSILLAIILLYVFFRRLSGILLPLSIVILTTLSVLSLYIFLGYHFNTLTITIPLFIAAIGIADAIHIYSLWYREKTKGIDNFQAVTISISKNFSPIILTSITSVIGFSSLIVSEIVPVATLGTATAIGIIIAFLISIFWMPAILFLLTKPINPHQKISKKLSFNYGLFILNKQKEIIISFIVIITLFGLGIIYIKIDSDMIKLFSKNVEIRKSANFIQKNLTGTQSYTIVIDSGENGNIKDPHFLKTVAKFSKDYNNNYQNIRYIYSLINIIKHYNKVVNNDNSIPDNRNLIAQYLLLYTLSLPSSSSIDTLIDVNERKLHINILTDQSTTTYSKKMIEDIKKWWEKTPYKITVTGKTVLNTALQNNITDTLIYSLAITLLIISIVMFLIFKKIKILWILILPNILPIILVLGIMGWFNINLDMGAAISATIIISIAIDDSIHYLIKYFQLEADHSLSIENRLNKILEDAGKALFFTTILLTLTFLINLSSQFIPNQHFAILTSIGLVSAFLIDILLLPVLLIKYEKSLDK